MKPLKEYEVYAVAMDSIFIEDGFNCRDAFPPASVRSLAKSIGDSGLQNPIFVVMCGDRYQLIAGHRRFLAVKWFVGWEDIPCRILSGLDSQTLQVINFVENLERKDLNIVEESDTLPKLWPNGYPPMQEMAKTLGKSKTWIDIRIKVCALEDNIKDLATSGVFNNQDIRRLTEFKPEERQRLVHGILKTKRSNRRFKISEVTLGKHKRKTNAEVRMLISKMMRLDMSGLPVRLLAWTLGHIDTADIDKEIREESNG